MTDPSRSSRGCLRRRWPDHAPDGAADRPLGDRPARARPSGRAASHAGAGAAPGRRRDRVGLAFGAGVVAMMQWPTGRSRSAARSSSRSPSARAGLPGRLIDDLVGVSSPQEVPDRAGGRAPGAAVGWSFRLSPAVGRVDRARPVGRRRLAALDRRRDQRDQPDRRPRRAGRRRRGDHRPSSLVDRPLPEQPAAPSS